MNIQGQAALVTGGGSGLGEATARELARLGAKVAVLDLNMANAERVAQDLCAQHGAGAAVAVQCNVSDPDSMAQAIETAAAAPDRVKPCVIVGSQDQALRQRRRKASSPEV